MRLLSPLQQLPQIEVVGSLVKLSGWKSTEGEEHLSLDVFSALFLTQPADQETVIPSHKCEVVFTILNAPDLEPQRARNVQFYGCEGKNIRATDSVLSVRSSDLFEARKTASFKHPGASALIRNDEKFAQGISVTLNLYSATAERYMALVLSDLREDGMRRLNERRWRNGFYTFVERFR